jgi:hypothetical protein
MLRIAYENRFTRAATGTGLELFVGILLIIARGPVFNTDCAPKHIAAHKSWPPMPELGSSYMSIAIGM